MWSWIFELAKLLSLSAAGFWGSALPAEKPLDTGDTPAHMLHASYCGDCHEAEYREWRDSRHAISWTNGLFRQDYRRTPGQWCRNCHAPLEAQQAELDGTAGDAGDAELASEGVSCAVCHVRDGVIHARRKRPDSPHTTREVAGFGDAAFCAGCHQFNFPVFGETGALSHYSAFPMQNTVAQVLANPARPAGDCRACHAVDGAGHRYPGSHEPAMLRRALEMTLCREEPARLAVTVRNAGAGHNVPTGDVHRHLLVRAWRSTEPVRAREAFYGRRFKIVPTGGKRATWDSTIRPGQSKTWRIDEATLGASDEPINVELRYVYAAQEYPRRSPGEPTYQTVERVRRVFADLPACDR